MIIKIMFELSKSYIQNMEYRYRHTLEQTNSSLRKDRV